MVNITKGSTIMTENIPPEAGWVAIMMAALTGAVSYFTAALKKKQTLELAMIEALQEQVDELHNKVDEHRQEIRDLHEIRYKDLQERYNDQAYILMLIHHINEGFPPPAPERPKGKHEEV